jgi:hypothetical protein
MSPAVSVSHQGATAYSRQGLLTNICQALIFAEDGRDAACLPNGNFSIAFLKCEGCLSLRLKTEASCGREASSGFEPGRYLIKVLRGVNRKSENSLMQGDNFRFRDYSKRSDYGFAGW